MAPADSDGRIAVTTDLAKGTIFSIAMSTEASDS
jgi:hypothetical protein